MYKIARIDNTLKTITYLSVLDRSGSCIDIDKALAFSSISDALKNSYLLTDAMFPDSEIMVIRQVKDKYTKVQGFKRYARQEFKP